MAGVPEVRVPPQELREDFEAVFDRLADAGEIVWLDVGRQRLLLVNDADRVRQVLIERARELVKPRLQTIDTGRAAPEVVDERVPTARLRRALATGLADRTGDLLRAVAEASAVETAAWRDGEAVALMPPLRRIAIRVACAGLLASAPTDEEVERVEAVMRWWDELPRVSTPRSRRFAGLTRHGIRRGLVLAQLSSVAASLAERADLSRPTELTAVVRDLPELAPELGEGDRMRLLGELLLGAAGPLTQTAGWLLLRFATEPDAAGSVRAEWDDVLAGGAAVEPAALSRLRRTTAFVREVTRLHPTNPRITRVALVDTVVGGEPVPACTRVVLNVNRVNRDARFYESPERFLPERWLDGPPATHKLAYVSFGAGERRCLGEGPGLEALVALLPALTRDRELRFGEARASAAGRRQLAEETTVSLRSR